VKVLYAIVETAGRQYRVEEGKILYTERQKDYSPGDEIVFDRVVFVRKDGEVLVGKPYVEGAKVVGKVLEHAKARKVKTVKYRPRKSSKVEKGHRQWYTAIKIEKIEL